MSKLTVSPTLRKRIRILITIVVAIAAAVLLVVFSDDLIIWLRAVWQNVRMVPLGLVVLALAFRTVEALLTALSWRNVLQATYPEETVRYRTVLGGYQGGVGLNMITPAQAGTFATLALFRAVIPGSTVTSLLAGFAVHQLAFGLFGALTYVFLYLARPEAPAEGFEFLAPVTDFVAGRPLLTIVLALGGIALLVVAGRMAQKRIRRLKKQVQPAADILRTPRRYLLLVFLPVAGAYACRWIVTGTFLLAFNIPVTAYTILLVLASNSIAGIVRFTPGGIGTKQALNVIALRNYAPADVVTAYSLTQDMILTAFNIGFAILTMAWAFGWTETRRFIRNRHEFADRAQRPTPEEGNN